MVVRVNIKTTDEIILNSNILDCDNPKGFLTTYENNTKWVSVGSLLARIQEDECVGLTGKDYEKLRDELNGKEKQ